MITPREAEVAAENYWIDQGCLTRRALRTKWARVDFFGADVIGKDATSTVWCQVTTAQRTESVRRRRRRLEEIPWLASDRVFLFELEMRPNPVRRSRIDYFFRVHEYVDPLAPDDVSTRSWRILDEPIAVTRDMLRVRPRAAPRVSGTTKLIAQKTRDLIVQGKM